MTISSDCAMSALVRAGLARGEPDQGFHRPASARARHRLVHGLQPSYRRTGEPEIVSQTVAVECSNSGFARAAKSAITHEIAAYAAPTGV